MNTQLAGISEFWECIKTRPAAQIGECLALLPGGEKLEFDITKPPKIPVQIKPDWVWFAAGFIVAWVLKR